MRNAYYILVFLTYVLLNGCTETERLDGEGILRMKVNVDSSIKVVTSRTVTDDEQAELEKNCEVRLYNGKGLIRYYKGLSGADVAKSFEKYGIYEYITKYFE